MDFIGRWPETDSTKLTSAGSRLKIWTLSPRTIRLITCCAEEMLDQATLMSKLTRREFMSLSAGVGLAISGSESSERMLARLDPADLNQQRDNSQGGGPMPFY